MENCPSLKPDHENQHMDTGKIFTITSEDQIADSRVPIGDTTDPAVPAGTPNASTDNTTVETNPGITELFSLPQTIAASQSFDQVLSTVRSWLLIGAKPKHIQAHRAPKELVSY